MKSNENYIEKARSTKKESRQIDFKESFDILSARDWCEVIKDIVAMANTGGGILIFGVRNNGTHTSTDLQMLLDIDPADITNKIFKYTGSHFADFEITKVKHFNRQRAAFLIDSVYPPLIFLKPGTYNIDGSRQGTAFSQGTLYFRHGAKSEPANSSDLERIIEREISRRKKQWLGNIKKVFKVDDNDQIKVVSSRMLSDLGLKSVSVNITTNKDAQKVQIEETSIFTKYFKYDTSSVVSTGRKIFVDFKANQKFYNILRGLKTDPSIYRVKYLDSINQMGASKGFYTKRVFEVLGKHYERAR